MSIRHICVVYVVNMRLGIVRGISYGLFGEPDDFVPQARALGAGLVRAYVYWGQVEPRPGEYDFHVVDRLLTQLDGDTEVWLTVCSSSPWATRQATDFLPPSPAKDLGQYGEFVRRLVGHCAGRVKYWQCDNEPSNEGLLWAGTAEEYVTQLAAFHQAVKTAQPAATVVLGGCGYDVLGSPGDSPQREFFTYLTDRGRDSFDVFDVHLYGTPSMIPSYVDQARTLMSRHGYEKPVVAGEFGGPVLFEFPELDPILQQAMAQAFAQPPETQSVEALRSQAGQDTPERRAMVWLYEHQAELPDQLRMFLDTCPPELAARRDRIHCRQVVTRVLLASASGIEVAAYWNLAPEVPGEMEPYQMMHLLFGKLVLMRYDGTALTHRTPAADTFALLAEQLRGTTQVTGNGNVFTVDRADRPQLTVLWHHRDTFGGEDEPAVRVCLTWDAPNATAVDAFGAEHKVEVANGTLTTMVTDTPVFVTPVR
ncbi:hypothetical protein GCM10029964_036900 [Kibdelosporangium lantanae]